MGICRIQFQEILKHRVNFFVKNHNAAIIKFDSTKRLNIFNVILTFNVHEY